MTAAHWDRRDIGFVQSVARLPERAGTARRVPHGDAATASTSSRSATGDGFGDAQALGREIASLLGGKGGGAGRVFQGKAASLDSVDRAVARLAAARASTGT